MPITISLAKNYPQPWPTAGSDARTWKYDLTGFPSNFLKAGQKLALDFKKGTRIRNPKEYTDDTGALPAGAPTSDISTDESGNTVVSVTVTATDVTAGKVSIEFLAKGTKGEDVEISLDRLDDGRWRTIEKLKGHAPLAQRAAEYEPGDALAFVARYEALKLASLAGEEALLSRLRRLPESVEIGSVERAFAMVDEERSLDV